MNRKQADSGQDKTVRVAAYIRVSFARQANEGDSLTAQKNEVEQEIIYRCRRNHWTVTHKDFYVDAGKSAKNQNRPQLQRLKRDIEEGKVDVVICFKLDRITLSLNDFVSLWQLFAKHNVDVISLREQFDTSIPAGRAMLGVIMVFAQMEREMTSERTFAIMKDRVERGLWNGGHVLGYKSDPADKGKLLVEEEGANIVRRVFDLFEELGSAGAVTRKLNDLGIRYPTFTTRSEKVRGGKLFTKQKIIGILRNRIYLGEIHWGEAEQANCHDAIIKSDQFDRVQLRLGQTVKRRQNLKKARFRRYLLTGLLRCQCGAHMVGAAAHGRHGVYRYYVCTRQNHEGGKHSCQAPRLPADALEHALLERLRELGTLVEAREKVVRRALVVIGIQNVLHADYHPGMPGRGIRQAQGGRRNRPPSARQGEGRWRAAAEVLKTMGTKGIASVQDELVRLESEEKELQANLAEIQRRQEPMLRVSEEAKKFVQTWTDVGGPAGSGHTRRTVPDAPALRRAAGTPQYRPEGQVRYVCAAAVPRGSSAPRTGKPGRPGRRRHAGPRYEADAATNADRGRRRARQRPRFVNRGRSGSHDRPESSAGRIRS
jgi:DNA invertase Pin-like site-specific DNA recombinase